jgi:hypothetical protein
VARNAYFWAWPMVNIYNRRLAFDQCPEPGLMNGVLPFAPLNTLSMLHDYVQPEQRWVACPNQDVVYGAGIAALDRSPVVVQVPDFAGRFWVYQVVDLRTDGFAQIGAMYGTPPGFYLLVGPAWAGEIPRGIVKVFRSPTNTAFVVPRVFQDDSPQDKRAVRSVISGIDLYALDKFDGKMKHRDWTKLPKFAPPGGDDGEGETAWVFPDRFFDQLPDVLADAPPLPGEEALYAQILAVIDAAYRDSSLKKAMINEATTVEKGVIAPLLQFRDWGVQLPNNWSAVSNPAHFGTDYFARTAVARSNILGERARRDEVSVPGSRCRRRPSERRQALRRDVRQRPNTAGVWILVAHPVRRTPLLRAERHEPVLLGHEEQGSQDERGWFDDDLRASRSAARRAAHQLAAGPKG